MATAARMELASGAPGRRAAGVLLLLSGIGLGVADALYPRASGAYQQAAAAMEASPHWASAHWIELVTAILLALAIWWLADTGWTGSSPLARAGARLAILATLLMAVGVAVELTLPANAALGSLARPILTVGWPAFGLAFIFLALGVTGPLWARILGVIGGIGLGVAGFATQGLQHMWGVPLFLLGYLLAIWMIDAGFIAFQRRREPV